MFTCPRFAAQTKPVQPLCNGIIFCHSSALGHNSLTQCWCDLLMCVTHLSAWTYFVRFIVVSVRRLHKVLHHFQMSVVRSQSETCIAVLHTHIHTYTTTHTTTHTHTHSGFWMHELHHHSAPVRNPYEVMRVLKPVVMFCYLVPVLNIGARL